MTTMRYLRDNARSSAPSEFCFLAVGGTEEQISDRPRRTVVSYSCHAALWCRVEDGRITRSHEQLSTSPEDYWTYLDGRMSPERPILVVAYDATRALTLLGLWRLLDSGRYSHRHIVDTDPPVIVPIYSGKSRVTFCDLRNWMREPWQEISSLVCPGCSDMSDRGIPPTDPGSRCGHDVEIVRRVMLGLVDYVRSHDLGNFRRTIGGQSLAAYRHRFGPRKTRVVIETRGAHAGELVKRTQVFPLSHDNAKVLKLERRANFGGREECYYVGDICPDSDFWLPSDWRQRNNPRRWVPGPVYLVDVNSLYPSVMAEHVYPWKLVGWQNECTVGQLLWLTDTYCTIADVEVQTDLAYPHRRTDGRVIYPVGRYWTTLSGVELVAALRRGHVVTVGLHACYRAMNLFSRYVDYFWRLKSQYRQSGNRVYYTLTKTLLNSLWGKFCQRGYSSRQLTDWPVKCRWGKEWVIDDRTKEDYEVQYRAGVAWRVDRTEIALGALPAIGACVTAAAREKMRQYMTCLAPRDCLYMGVDSLVLTQSGYDRLCKSWQLGESGLGQMRLVGTYQTGVIRSQQDYQLGEDKVVRGLPHVARQCERHAYTFDQRVGLAGQLCTTPQEQITYCEMTREYQHIYHGGSVGPDGWVSPLILPGEDGGNHGNQSASVAGDQTINPPLSE